MNATATQQLVTRFALGKMGVEQVTVAEAVNAIKSHTGLSVAAIVLGLHQGVIYSTPEAAYVL